MKPKATTTEQPNTEQPTALDDTLATIVNLIVAHRYPDGPTISDIARATQSASRALHIDRHKRVAAENNAVLTVARKLNALPG
jgi:hypothetical protein